MPRSKYNIGGDKEKRTCDRILFDSQLEMRYYKEAVLPQLETGELIKVERQIPFVLQPEFIHEGNRIKEIVYVADFVLTHEDGLKEVVDVKGFADATALLKRKMFWFRYPTINYRWVTYSAIDGGWVDYDKVKRNRAQRKREKQRNEKE